MHMSTLHRLQCRHAHLLFNNLLVLIKRPKEVVPHGRIHRDDSVRLAFRHGDRSCDGYHDRILGEVIDRWSWRFLQDCGLSAARASAQWQLARNRGLSGGR
jgi:hypothetical protein